MVDIFRGDTKRGSEWGTIIFVTRRVILDDQGEVEIQDEYCK